MTEHPRSPRQPMMRILATFAAVLLALSLAAPGNAAITGNVKRLGAATDARNDKDKGNYDIRDDNSAAAKDKIDRQKDKLGKERKEKIKGKKDKIDEAIVALEREIPGLEVMLSKHTGGPEIVGTKKGPKKLTGKNNEQREKVAREFLKKNTDLYGVSVPEIAQMKKSSDYTNPAGNITWVEFKQELNGLPVFQGEIRTAFTSEGELLRTVGTLVPALDDLAQNGKPDLSTKVSAADAVRLGAAAIGMTLDPAALTRKSSSADGTQFVFSGGGFTDDTKVALEYFPLDSGVVALAWSMTLWRENDAYYLYVGGEEGDVLFRKNITEDQTQPATYVFYDNDSPAPSSPTTALPGLGFQAAQIGRSTLTTIADASFPDPWMPDGTNTTTGNNVDAGLDLVSPNGVEASTRPIGSPFRVFDFPYNPGPGIPPPGESPTLANYRNGEVVNMFVWSNRYHDRLYNLGFTEAARNFQLNNFGRGGLGNDRVLAEGQDFSGTDNANFSTPADGSSGRMQMYIFTGPTPDRTSGLDMDVLLHELTHGTSNRLHANASGLSSTMSRGMGEGWSDYYARALLSGGDEDVNGVFTTGGWVTYLIDGPSFVDNYYYGIRRFPYVVKSNVGPNGRPHNPLTFADIDPAQANINDGAYPPAFDVSPFEVHNIGEVWCMTLLEVRARLINRLGWMPGNQRALQLTTDGMKLDPINPTFVDGRNAILAANFASGDAATEVDIWRGFATRGVGFSASAVSAASSVVVEAFDLPFSITNITVTGDSCDASGTIDPGETVTISVTATNSFQLASVNDVVISLNLDGSQSFGSLGPGASATRSFTFTVPSTATCGSRLDLTFSISSGIGVDTKTFPLQIGTATGQVPAGSFSSGNVAVTIPDNTTVEVPINVTGTGVAGDVNVSVRLNHTFDGDLVISLVAPDGKVVVLSSNRGGSGDNFGTGANDCSGVHTVFDDQATNTIASGVAPFAGSFRPDSPLSGMVGHEMNGIWKLRISDTATLDTGLIGCASLEINEQLYFCCGVAGTPIVIAAPPAVLVTECGNAMNGAPDPGEVVTMNLPLRNNGSGLTTNLVATLESSGGITAITTSQNYGVISPVSGAVSRPFTFAIDSSVMCGADAVATLHLIDAGTDLGSVSFNIRTGAVLAATHNFANTTQITIPGTGTGGTTTGSATPYPSSISVSGVSGTITTVRLGLLGFSHTFPSDVDVLLVGPGGQTFIPFSDLGGGTDAVNLNITLDDAAAALPPSILVSGTFRPSNSGTGDIFLAPAPAAPYASATTAGTATFASTFGGANPNGTWSLFVMDDAGTDVGQFAGGWTLSLDVAEPSCITVNAPSITGEAVNKTTLWPPNHQLEDVVVSYGVDCASCSLSVTSSEPVNGEGDGDTGPDWTVIDNHHVRLRAERAGNGSDRIYTIAISCFNGAGTTVKNVTVRVPHDQGN